MFNSVWKSFNITLHYTNLKFIKNIIDKPQVFVNKCFKRMENIIILTSPKTDWM